MRVGTRASALALAQAGWLVAQLPVAAELVPITTSGDRARALGDKSRWVAELETALLDGRIDLAVHSAKDVPGELATGLELVAIPERADPRDALCGAGSLTELRSGARVGTSSLRRRAQIRAAREDLQVVELRGNVDTRLRKLKQGEVDALVLAYAGLQRLGREGEADGLLEWVPAPGQGALAVEAIPGRVDPSLLHGLIDAGAAACVGAERELAQELGASCQTAVGAHATGLGQDELELRAWVGLPDGSAWLSDHLRGPAAGLGARLAHRLRCAGAQELLREAAHQAAAT